MIRVLSHRRFASALLLLLHVFVAGLVPLADSTFGAPPRYSILGPPDGSANKGPGHDATHENCQFTRLLADGSLLAEGIERIQPVPLDLRSMPATSAVATPSTPRSSPLGSRAPPVVQS